MNDIADTNSQSNSNLSNRSDALLLLTFTRVSLRLVTLTHICKANISYGNAVYHKAPTIYHWKVLRYPGCNSPEDIRAENRRDYFGTRDDVINMGYVPCKKCCP